MKKIAPFLVIVGLVLLLVGGGWYEISLSKPFPVDTTLTITTSTITGASLQKASTTAKALLATLKVNGRVPLDASALPRNPSPLFVPAQ